MIPRLPSEFPPDQGIIPRSFRENSPVRPYDERANIPRRTGENPPGLARDLPGDVLQMSGGLYPDNPPDPFPRSEGLSPVRRGITPRLAGDLSQFGGGSTWGISPGAAYTVNERRRCTEKIVDTHGGG